MSWKKKTIPAVLLLSLAVPPAQGQGGGHAPAEAVRTAHAERAPRLPASSAPSRLRRRNESDGTGDIAPATLARACEYLNCRANGIEPDVRAAEAWQTFHAWCDAHIRRFAGGLGLRGVNVDDCAQEVWADLMVRLPHFRLDSSRGRFTSWLYTIVRSKATDMMRRQARSRAVSLSSETTVDLPGCGDDPAVLIERHGDREFVRAGLAKLRRQVSDLSYRVLHLRYFDGLDAPQVADSLGITPEQVWAREHRAKRRLGEILRATGRRLGISHNSGSLARATI